MFRFFVVFQICDDFLPTMTAIELDSFLSKFKQLCSSGLDAHLEAGSHAGQAWVSLCVGLGQLPKSHECHRQRKNGPARQKRRERREAVRKVSNDLGHENDQPVFDEVVAEEATLDLRKLLRFKLQVKRIFTRILIVMLKMLNL